MTHPLFNSFEGLADTLGACRLLVDAALDHVDGLKDLPRQRSELAGLGRDVLRVGNKALRWLQQLDGQLDALGRKFLPAPPPGEPAAGA